MGGAEVDGRAAAGGGRGGGRRCPSAATCRSPSSRREELGAYLRELFDAEYPRGQARADERLLQAFDLLPPGTDLRALRARVLEDNVAGFYDERPGKRRLYAVSDDRDLHADEPGRARPRAAPRAAGPVRGRSTRSSATTSRDFDDRRLAWTVAPRGRRDAGHGALRAAAPGRARGAAPERDRRGRRAALGAPGLFDVPGRAAGRARPARAALRRRPRPSRARCGRAAGAEALREAWGRPPESTEQVLHPEQVLRAASRRARCVPAVDGAARRDGSSPRASSARCCCGPCVEGGGEAGDRGLGRRRLAALGRAGANGPRLAQRVGHARPTRPSSTPPCARASRGAARRAARGAGQVFAGRAAGAFAVRRAGDAVELVSADDAALLERLLGRRAPGAVGARARCGRRHARLTRRAARRLECRAPGSTGRVGRPAKRGKMATSTPGGATDEPRAWSRTSRACCATSRAASASCFSVVAAIVEKQSRFVRFHAFQSLLLHARGHRRSASA